MTTIYTEAQTSEIVAGARTGVYQFGGFEANAATGELHRGGLRVRLGEQAFQLLLLLLAHPGEVVSREAIRRELWPEGTFVDFDHGVNSAVNRIRDALGDRASHPRFVETLARRGYRFVAEVRHHVPGQGSAQPGDRETTVAPPVLHPPTMSVAREASAVVRQENAPGPALRASLLSTEADLPPTSRSVVQALFIGLQCMYLAFYVGALANLREIADLLSATPRPAWLFAVVLGSAALLIPVRLFLLCAAVFTAPAFRQQVMRLWPFLLLADLAWAASPFLLLHHISFGLALACTTVLLYAPFAQRSLVLMGAGRAVATSPSAGCEAAG